MTAENFQDGMETFLEIRPYRVFTVQLHGGETLEIDHPRAIFVKGGAAVFLSPGGKPIYLDHDSVVHISGTSTEPAAT